MKWLRVVDGLPPDGKMVLAWSDEMGFVTVSRHHHPAWEPFDEEHYAGSALPDGIVENLRRLNEMDRGRPASDNWACVCEESYWDIDKFTHWAELPPEPEA